MKILIVEDNLLDRKLLNYLIKSNFKAEIDEAVDGQKAISLIQVNLYDLIITDIIMPKVEGLELINYIKRKGVDSTVFAISGSKPYYLYLAKKLGIDGVYTKPLDQEKFVNAINAKINNKENKNATSNT